MDWDAKVQAAVDAKLERANAKFLAATIRNDPTLVIDAFKAAVNYSAEAIRVMGEGFASVGRAWAQIIAAQQHPEDTPPTDSTTKE